MDFVCIVHHCTLMLTDKLVAHCVISCAEGCLPLLWEPAATEAYSQGPGCFPRSHVASAGGGSEPPAPTRGGGTRAASTQEASPTLSSPGLHSGGR